MVIFIVFIVLLVIGAIKYACKIHLVKILYRNECYSCGNKGSGDLFSWKGIVSGQLKSAIADLESRLKKRDRDEILMSDIVDRYLLILKVTRLLDVIMVLLFLFLLIHSLYGEGVQD